MKFLKFFSVFILCHQSICADLAVDDRKESGAFCLSQDYIHSKHSHKSTPCGNNSRSHSCQLGVSGHGGSMSLFYPIDVPSYPNPTPLSLNRNVGFVKGDVKLIPTGLKICRAGDYAVSFTAILGNATTRSNVISVFLVLNDLFDPNNLSTVGNTSTVFGQNPANFVVTSIVGSGILKNVPCGTTLSLVATNGESLQPDPLTVVAWEITAYRIPGCP